jgi:hypothetical protein
MIRRLLLMNLHSLSQRLQSQKSKFFTHKATEVAKNALDAVDTDEDMQK